MQLTSFNAIVLTFIALVSSACAITVSYDETYDNPNGDLNDVTCDNGPNGLLPKGFTNFKSLPSFPNIGGAAVVTSFNSPNCGTCWKLTYAGTGKSINVLAMDHADTGFNISLEALNTLTDNQGVALGAIDATATQVAPSECGL
ncbi:Cerato-platanin [Trametes coccinea BRFM310]|uniref:Cerato-platanin n=1 Tax=Trametes coccinea (strain BRFM310) TaxID=1353009 RepID=A0A1Y2IP20_TRAC3|nr:Cerato-platanin [Trametes coccinea BRFM310]